MGDFRLTRPMLVNDLDYSIFVIGFSNSNSNSIFLGPLPIHPFQNGLPQFCFPLMTFSFSEKKFSGLSKWSIFLKYKRKISF